MEETLIAYGSQTKALGEGKVGGYLVRFSTENDPDLTNDYFTKDTDLHCPPEVPVLYNHGLDKTIKKRVIGNAVVSIDEVGAWAESQLNMRDEYEKKIYEMVEAGKLGYSSGALSHLVERIPAGKGVSFIKSWFVGEVSLTPTPAEPRNSVVSIKSLIPDEAALPIDEKETNKSQGENKMEETIDIKALVAAEIKAMKDAEAAEAARKQEIEDAKAEGARKAVEELKSKRLLKASEYHTTDKSSDSDDGVGAFKAWLGSGQVNHELIEPSSAWMKTSGVTNLTTGAEGGYAVPDPLLNRIIAKRDLQSWVRQAPVQVFQTEADHILVPAEDTRYADFTSTNESAGYTNDTTGNIKQVDMKLIKYTSYLKVSEEFLSAKNSNWESWIGNVLGRVEANTENTLATAVAVAGATAGTAFATTAIITEPELARCVGELSNGYAVTGEAGFLMNNGVKWYCKGIAGNSFSFMPTPSGGDFFGFPAYVSDDMQANTTGLTPVIFGNWQYFGVVETPGMVVQRNPYLYMANGQVGIFAHIRRGYAVLQAEAIRKYNSVS
jgi:HK97 family phage major capsid protein